MAEHEIGGTATLRPRREVEIALLGCDDTTYMYIEVSPVELAFLRRLETASRAASEYGCMPTLQVEAQREKFNWRYGDDGEEADE